MKTITCFFIRSICIFCLFLNFSCLQKRQDKGEVLARAGKYFLYKTDLEKILTDTYTRQDSILLSRNYINSWAVDKILLEKAELNLGDTKIQEFEDLVAQYRQDLYTEAYKQALAKQSMDTVVSMAALDTMYQNTKESFSLNESLIKLRYIHLPLESNNIQAVRSKLKRFNTQDKKELDSIAIQFKSYSLNDSVWVKTSQLLQKANFIADNNAQENLKKSQFFELQDSLGVYLVQVKQVLLRNQIAPLEYVKPTVRQIILNKRKLEFTKKLEKDIIHESIQKKQFETYP